MYISDVRLSDGGKEYIVFDDTASSYIISFADFRRTEIPFSENSADYPFYADDELREKLQFYASKLRCIKYLQYYITNYGEKSIKKLREKAVAKEYSQEIVIAATDLLCEFSVIDEVRNCERRIQNLANSKLYGRYRIRQELIVSGFLKESINEAFENVEIDYYENAQRLYRKLTLHKDISDIRERKRISDKMVRYGYSYDEIKYASSCDYED